MTQADSSDSIDLLIRGGLLVDGTGGPPRHGDLAISGDRIVGVGSDIDAPHARVIDADGALVAPGWVDVHTHYDGQVTWDNTLDPSFLAGVITRRDDTDTGERPGRLIRGTRRG